MMLTRIAKVRLPFLPAHRHKRRAGRNGLTRVRIVSCFARSRGHGGRILGCKDLPAIVTGYFGILRLKNLDLDDAICIRYVRASEKDSRDQSKQLTWRRIGNLFLLLDFSPQ